MSKKTLTAQVVNKTYNVVEEFTSIQGEGHMQGTPMHFIRMGDCNRDCSFCDTKWDKWEEKTIEELVFDIKVEWVILTGGEPTLQDLRPLINKLHKIGHKVAIESNGYKPEHWEGADWICISPKGKHISRPTPSGEVKLLVGGLHDALLVERIEALYFQTNVTLQAVTKPDGTPIKENVDRAIALCLEYNVHYSARLHNYVGAE